MLKPSRQRLMLDLGTLEGLLMELGETFEGPGGQGGLGCPGVFFGVPWGFLGCPHRWMPEHSMQRVMPRLTLAQAGAGSRQSQQLPFPSSPSTVSRT